MQVALDKRDCLRFRLNDSADLIWIIRRLRRLRRFLWVPLERLGTGDKSTTLSAQAGRADFCKRAAEPQNKNLRNLRIPPNLS
jgi:hypothetical protein